MVKFLNDWGYFFFLSFLFLFLFLFLVFFFFFGWNVLNISVKKKIWSYVSFKATASLLVFFADDISTDVNRLLSPAIIEILSVSYVMSIISLYLGAPMLGALIFIIVFSC